MHTKPMTNTDPHKQSEVDLHITTKQQQNHHFRTDSSLSYMGHLYTRQILVLDSYVFKTKNV